MERRLHQVLVTRASPGDVWRGQLGFRPLAAKAMFPQHRPCFSRPRGYTEVASHFLAWESVPPMKVRRLDMTSFRGFRELTLEFTGPVTVLVGINGAGKTSILD